MPRPKLNDSVSTRGPIKSDKPIWNKRLKRINSSFDTRIIARDMGSPGRRSPNANIVSEYRGSHVRYVKTVWPKSPSENQSRA